MPVLASRTPLKPAVLPPRRNTQAAYVQAEMAKVVAWVDEKYVDNVEQDLRKITSRTVATTSVWDAIANAPGVVAAFERLKERLPLHKVLEADLYNPIVLLCNQISLAYASHMGLLRGNVIIFSSPHLTVTRGDFLDARAKSYLVSFPGSQKELRAVIRKLVAKPKTPYTCAQPWQLLSSVGEVKPRPKAGDLGQVKEYITLAKQYLPDHSEVHACHVTKKVLLYSLNSCGLWQSAAQDLDQLDAWVVHVALVYRSFLGRDRSLHPSLEQEEFIRWDYSFDGAQHVLAPFYVGAVPGRMTWAAFEVGDRGDVPSTTSLYGRAYFQLPPLGLVKVAWQDTKRRYSEGELLQHAHAGGWIPGLVRQRSFLSGDATQPLEAPGKPNEQKIKRIKHTLYLESIGQPLSMCTDYLHILKVIFDGIEMHLHLFERGILHRDISWANVLCNPRHLSAGNEDKKSVERPCISQILGNPQGEPCVLLADKD
ncbi:hypothetical protein EXIGLDRAFT_835100 [Exidia glandulosa HHB12029]|uniref:Fungal-type protein kinase domain-containing protein n=1 Tax=Exidia glandulosa HHB12029 TaxID=1314781 RepID=A0A166AQL9_EXIGL|nr:hypothetical protein EXIGLDRAFT_835100 [Exidia glandulosa HHB12029]